MSITKTALLVVIVATCLATSCLHKPSSLDKVSLRLNWSPTGEHAYIYLGIDKGFFKEQNIEVDVMPGQGSTIVAQLVGNGSNDFGLCSGDTVVISRSKAVPLKALAVFYHQYPGSVRLFKVAPVVGEYVELVLELADTFRPRRDRASLKKARYD